MINNTGDDDVSDEDTDDKENEELDLVHLGPVINLAELGCDKQYR